LIFLVKQNWLHCKGRYNYPLQAEPESGAVFEGSKPEKQIVNQASSANLSGQLKRGR
jgi:hypothetical protein